MSEILFKNESDVSDEWLAYIEGEVNSLLQRDEFSISNYVDREVNNPALLNYLDTQELEDFEDVTDGDDEELTLGFRENRMLKTEFLDQRRGRFKRFKRKVKAVFCRIVGAIEDVEPKEIIKKVLVALIPAFAGGLPAIILPILIGLLAALLKFGFDKVCPV